LELTRDAAHTFISASNTFNWCTSILTHSTSNK
jgi:hypothetical protein